MTDMIDVFGNAAAASEATGEGWRQAHIANKSRSNVAKQLGALLEQLRGIDLSGVHDEISGVRDHALGADHNFACALTELEELQSDNPLITGAQQNLAGAREAVNSPDHNMTLVATADSLTHELGAIQQALGAIVDRVSTMGMTVGMIEDAACEAVSLSTTAHSQIQGYRNLTGN